MGRKKILGLIVNPRSGLGGSTGLKGSDGAVIQQKALERGAVAHANERAAGALAQLVALREVIQVLTYPGEMGADIAQAAGFDVKIIGRIQPGSTTSRDTRRAAGEMSRLGVDLLLFAGGDGTARDIYDAVGTELAVLGIPAGVKIHSPVFATHPRAAGQLASILLDGGPILFKEAEVMDIDEDSLRQGRVSTRLYGYLKIPYDLHFVQSPKSSSLPGGQSAMDEIAAAVIRQMTPDTLYILGPGTSTRDIAARLNLEKTLVGVDVIWNGALLGRDVSEAQILKLLQDHPFAGIIITPIGGQGFLFGRGSQQISAKVITAVGVDNIIIVSTVQKIVSLAGRPLLVDTGDPDLDRQLSGYRRILTGFNQKMIYRVADHI